MRQGKLRPTGWILLIAGVLLLSAGWIGLSGEPDLFQYAFLPSGDAAALPDGEIPLRRLSRGGLSAPS